MSANFKRKFHEKLNLESNNKKMTSINKQNKGRRYICRYTHAYIPAYSSDVYHHQLQTTQKTINT